MTESNTKKQCFSNILSVPNRRRWFGGLCLATGSLVFASYAQAQEQQTTPPKPGQVIIPKSFDGDVDFEEACRLRLNVDSIETLKEIITLTESALKKGLDETDSDAAKKMIAACYVQKTEESVKLLSGAKQMSRARQSKLLNELVDDLGRAIEYNPLMVDAYLMKIEIHASRKEIDEALELANVGIEKLLPESQRADTETKGKLSRLLMMRAGLRSSEDDVDGVVSDLKKSITLNPNNVASIAVLQNKLVKDKKFDEAIEFFSSVLKSSPDNEMLICSTAGLMADGDHINDALDLLKEKIKLLPKSSELLKTRAKVYAVNKEPDLAKEDMDLALKLSESDVEGLLMRAKLRIQSKDLDGARKDVDSAFELDNNRVETVYLRSAIAADQKRFGDAIKDLQLIIKAQPKEKDTGLMIQLGLLYSQDNRPTQAIKVFDQVIKADEDNWLAYRFRGDTRLSLGDHADAIADFEKAIELAPKDEEDRSGSLNNLSWVLSTSPLNNVRDGKRSLDYAIEACELTDYAKPHILSTLAAAYAETGDFEKAIEWSSKAVTIATENKDKQLEQLESELKSYQEKKPWREKIETKENKAPIAPGVSGVDT